MDLAVPLTHPTPADLGCCDAKFSNDYGRCNRLYEVGKLLFILRGDGLALLLLCKLAELTCYWGLYPPANNWSFSVTTSAKGGVDIKIGSDTIHAPRHLSVRHPLLQMVLFANIYKDAFFCMESMVPKSIVDMTKKSRSSASGNVYGAGWIPAKPKSKSPNAATVFGFNRRENIGRNNEPSIPVLFSDISTKEETSTTVSATPGPGDSGYHIATIEANKGSRVSNQIISKLSCEHSGGSGSEGIQRQQLLQQDTLTGGNHVTGLQVLTAQEASFLAYTNIKKIHTTSMGSVNCGKGVSRSVLDAAPSIHEQLILNSPGDEGSDSPRSNVSPGITSSAETTRVPMPHVLNGNESEHTRRIDPAVTDDILPLRATYMYMITAGADQAKTDKAILDSGSPVSCTGDKSLLHGYVELPPDAHAYGIGGRVRVHGYGNISNERFQMKGVYHIPDLNSSNINKTIFSVSELDSLGYSVNTENGFLLTDRRNRTWSWKTLSYTGAIVGKGHIQGGLYVVDFLKIPLDRVREEPAQVTSWWEASWLSKLLSWRSRRTQNTLLPLW